MQSMDQSLILSNKEVDKGTPPFLIISGKARIKYCSLVYIYVDLAVLIILMWDWLLKLLCCVNKEAEEVDGIQVSVGTVNCCIFQGKRIIIII